MYLKGTFSRFVNNKVLTSVCTLSVLLRCLLHRKRSVTVFFCALWLICKALLTTLVIRKRKFLKKVISCIKILEALNKVDFDLTVIAILIKNREYEAN